MSAGGRKAVRGLARTSWTVALGFAVRTVALRIRPVDVQWLPPADGADLIRWLPTAGAAFLVVCLVLAGITLAKTLVAYARAVACAPPSAPTAGTRHTYVVQAGDTLWSIAAKTLGSPKRWDELAQLNAMRVQRDGEVFDDPRHLRAGWVFQLPREAEVQTEAPSRSLFAMIAALGGIRPPLRPVAPPTARAERADGGQPDHLGDDGALLGFEPNPRVGRLLLRTRWTDLWWYAMSWAGIASIGLAVLCAATATFALLGLVAGGMVLFGILLMVGICVAVLASNEDVSTIAQVAVGSTGSKPSGIPPSDGR